MLLAIEIHAMIGRSHDAECWRKGNGRIFEKIARFDNDWGGVEG